MDMEKRITGFSTIAIYTMRKLLLSKRVYITMLITLFIVSIMAYATTQEISRLDGGSDLMDFLILNFFMPVMAMIYGSSLIRDEMDDKSITQVVTSPMERAVTYTAYYLGLAVSVTVIMLVILTAGFLSFFGGTELDSTAWGIYGSYAGLVVIGSFVYSALFIMVSVLISQPIYFGLFYAFIWETFIGNIPGRMQLLTVKHYVRSIGSEWLDHGGISTYPNATSLGDSAIVLVAFTIAVFVMGAWLFREKEFT
jgi:ABC-2 type transport system permease protein